MTYDVRFLFDRFYYLVMSGKASTNFDGWLLRIGFLIGAASGVALSLAPLHRELSPFPDDIGGYPIIHYVLALPGIMILAFSGTFAVATFVVNIAIWSNVYRYLEEQRTLRNVRVLGTCFMGVSISHSVGLMLRSASPAYWSIWLVVFALSLGVFWGLDRAPSAKTRPTRMVYQTLVSLSPRPIWILTYLILLLGNTISFSRTSLSSLDVLHFISLVNVNVIGILLGVGLILLAERSREKTVPP